MVDYLVEGIYEAFQVFKTLAKMYLQTKDVLDNKQYLFFLQLLGK